MLLELSPFTSDTRVYREEDKRPLEAPLWVDVGRPNYPQALALSAPVTAGEVSEEPFTLNFTIDNLRYSADMGRPGSLKFNITDSLMQHLVRGQLPRPFLHDLSSGLSPALTTLALSFLSSSARCSREVA